MSSLFLLAKGYPSAISRAMLERDINLRLLADFTCSNLTLAALGGTSSKVLLNCHHFLCEPQHGDVAYIRHW